MNIEFKKSIFLISFFLIFILSIGFVSASDIENNDGLVLEDSFHSSDNAILTVDSINDECYEGSDSSIHSIDVGEAADDNEGDELTDTSFEKIQEEINEANENDIINLSGKYSGDSTIIVNKSLTIKGVSKDTSLDLNKLGQILYVNASNVIFENLMFTNTNNYANLNASNIFINASGQCSFINCSFTNCNSMNRAVICSESSGISIENCSFDKCTGEYVIYSISSTGSIKNSNFTNSGANENLVDFENSSIINCSFYNIGIPHELAYVVVCKNLINSSFENCICKNSYGICVSMKQADSVVENCIFKNSSVRANFTVEQIGSYYGNVSLLIRIVDYYCGNPVSNQNSIITFYDLNTHNDMFNRTLTKTDENGDLIYALPLDAIECGARIEPFGPYTWSAGSISKIKILKAPTVLTPSKYVVPFNSSKTFNIKLLHKITKKPASKVKLNIKIYTGKKYKSYNRVTDAMGMIKLKASTFAAGTHKVIITGNNKNYIINKTQTSIKISKASTNVLAPKVTNKYKKSKYFKVTVKSKVTKKPVKAIKIKIKVWTGKKHRTYVVKTNAKGVAKLNTKSLKRGNHKVVISSGSANYKISKKSAIRIK